MPTEFGQKFYDETINNPGTFKNQETFNEFFPGLYVTTTFGSGNILSVASSVLKLSLIHISTDNKILKRSETGISVLSTVVTSKRPVVNVPVLSNATVFTRVIASK